MSTRLKLPILLLALGLFCGGCTLIDEMQQRPAGAAAHPPAAAPAARGTAVLDTKRTPDVHWLFHYYRLASTLSGSELEDEYQQANRAFTLHKSAENQWRLAILLGIPGTSFYDTGRSSTLFKELTNEEFHQPPELNDAAYVMYSLLNAQNQLDKKLSSATDRLNESQSANKKMQEQLDALKAIESTLYQRNKAEETPKP
jgi:hypothetical protein